MSDHDAEPAVVQLARMEGKLDAALSGMRQGQADLGRRVGAVEQDQARGLERAQVQAVTLAEMSGRVEGLRDETTRLRAVLDALPGTARQNLVAGIAVASLALSLSLEVFAR